VRGGGSVIDEWMDSVPAKVQQKFDQRWDILRCRNIPDWPYDYAHKRRGTNGLWELKFEVGGTAYRPLFFLGPYQEEATVLLFAVEGNDRLKPVNADSTAQLRMQKATADPTKALIYDG